MIKALLIVFSVLLFLISCNRNESTHELSREQLIEHRIDSLLSVMTLKEKAGQMTLIGLAAITEGEFWVKDGPITLDSGKMKDLLADHHVGAIQNSENYPPSPEEWSRLIASIQAFSLAKNSHGIPVLYVIDGVHGANFTYGSTMLPHQIGLAATWNREMAYATGEITAYELRASSIPMNFAPVVDVSPQPLWGRIFETFGEDPYLTSEMGVAFSKGSQGSSMGNPLHTGVCLKHYIGYGAPYNGKDRATTLLPERYLRQYYLPPFESAIEAGVMAIMLNSGSLNGIPGHINSYWINDVLKGELGFKGMVVSDFADIYKLVDVHRIVPDIRNGAKLAILAGMDMCMVPYDASFAEDIVDLVESGEIPLSRIDDAVRRILRVKFMLNLFENPFSDPSDYPDFGSEKFAGTSFRAAAESITLLKNKDNILPLGNNEKRFLITGPAANSLNAINGSWTMTWAGDDPAFNNPEKLTIVEAFENKFDNAAVSYIEGCDYEQDINIKDALRSAVRADYIICCLGEKPATEKPSDINELELPDVQVNLVKELERSGKPVIVILVQGRPRIIRDLEPFADAILMAYLPGNEGGRALASIIAGDISPSGKLPYTWPKFSGNIMPYYHKGTDKIDNSFGPNGFDPQYEFGYGLSYTEFEYSNLSLNTDTLQNGQCMEVSFSLKNTGDIKAKEIIQIYIRDQLASISPDEKKLVEFSKVELLPGKDTVITSSVPTEKLAFINENNVWVTEEGWFDIFVGGNPQNLLQKSFYLKNEE